MNNVNVGYLLLCLCGLWQIGLVIFGWTLCIRYQRRGLAGMLPNLREYFSKVKNGS